MADAAEGVLTGRVVVTTRGRPRAAVAAGDLGRPVEEAPAPEALVLAPKEVLPDPRLVLAPRGVAGRVAAVLAAARTPIGTLRVVRGIGVTGLTSGSGMTVPAPIGPATGRSVKTCMRGADAACALRCLEVFALLLANALACLHR